MTNAYNPEVWREVYLMLGGALAALAGLLFVAISVRIDVIGKAAHWRVRAFGITFALIGLLIISTLVMLPQSTVLLGAELIVANLFLLLFVPVRTWVMLGRLNTKEPAPTMRLLSGILAWIVGALGGASLIAETGGGMYLVTASCLTLIWIGVLNAWSFITVEGTTAN
jgi:hypothetical protein